MHPHDDPLTRFQGWFDDARASDAVSDATVMTLATVSPEGKPAARTVLLKGVDAQGLVFYTNRNSRKGQHLAATWRAALCFYWEPLGRQVLVEGEVAEVTEAEADAYFASRPRLSQIGAWASRQSETLGAPEELEARVAELQQEFEGRDVPRPPHWSGYRVAPDMMEFWTAGDGRLHVRERYLRDAGGAWTHAYVNP